MRVKFAGREHRYIQTQQWPDGARGSYRPGRRRPSNSMQYKGQNVFKSLKPKIDVRDDIAIVSVSGVMTADLFGDLIRWSFEHARGAKIRCWIARYEKTVFACYLESMMAFYSDSTAYRAHVPCAFVVTPAALPMMTELGRRAAQAGYLRLVATSYEYALAWAWDVAIQRRLDEERMAPQPASR